MEFKRGGWSLRGWVGFKRGGWSLRGVDGV